MSEIASQVCFVGYEDANKLLLLVGSERCSMIHSLANSLFEFVICSSFPKNSLKTTIIRFS